MWQVELAEFHLQVDVNLRGRAGWAAWISVEAGGPLSP